jgi:hypothetical protein
MVVAVAGSEFALGADSGRHAWIVVKGRHGDLSDKPGQIVADFPTEDQAAADAAARNTRERDLGILYSIKLRKIPRPGVLSGTGEYSANIVEVYRRVKRGSDFLKNHTGELTRRAFNDINGAIRGFNDQYDQAKTAGTLPAGVARVDEVSESAFRGTLVDDQKPAGEQAGGASGSGKYQVWVYELVGNQWVKRNERTWFTDDAAAAHNYKDQVDAKKPRWTATTNAPKESNSPAAPAGADQAAAADLAAFQRDMEAYNRDRRAFNQEANAFERERKAVQSELDAVDRAGLAFNELSDAERTDARLDALNRQKANAERRADQIISRSRELKQRQADLDKRKAELASRAETLGGVLETRD